MFGRGVRIARDYRANERIRVPEVRLVDEEGEQLGVMPTGEALELAEQRGYDLVEVAPAAKPPVCRLMDFGKFKYEATRKERESRKAQKSRVTNILREVRMKTRIGEHDRLAKTRLVKRLLDQGSKVKVSVMFRGREIEHPEVGMVLLKAVADHLIDDALLESPPRFESRRSLSMVLSPPIKKAEPTAKPEVDDEPAADSEAAATQVADSEAAEPEVPGVEAAATQVAESEAAEPEVAGVEQEEDPAAQPEEKVLNRAEA